jgi:hypothetical protein
MTDFTEIWRAIRTAEIMQRHEDLHELLAAHYESERRRKAAEQAAEERRKAAKVAAELFMQRTVAMDTTMDLEGWLDWANKPKRPTPLLDTSKDVFFFDEIPQED